MAEDLVIIKSESKEQQYQSLLPQIEALISGEDDLTANLANIAAALKEQFGWLWVGFYLVKKNESRFVEWHARESLNFQITVAIIVIILFITIIGILIAWIVGIISLVLVIIATIRASEGKLYKYPFSIRLIK